MLIKTLPVGHLETNCYIVTDEKTLECAIIDPGADSNTILDYVESNKLIPRAIYLTHGHFDHFMALEAVMEATGAPAYINKNDANTGGLRDAYKLDAGPELGYFAEGDVMEAGSLRFRVMETPGHSAGSVSLICERAIFSGDTLFRDSCGRTDLGGDMETLLTSLHRLSSLDGDYDVYPGHAEATTLERERRFNYYVRYADGELTE